MPRSFDMSVEYGGSVEQVHDAFSDEQYWLARLAEAGVAESTLDSLEVRSDGSITVATTLVLPRDLLPAIATQFHSGDMQIRRRETWQPVRDGRASGTVDCAIVGAPATMTGTTSLTPNGAGSRMELHAKVEVRIPLVGGKLESFIGSQLTNLLTEEQRFTTTWLAQGSLNRGVASSAMARRMDYVVTFDAPVEKVYLDFTDREYWDALMAAYRWLSPESELTQFSSGAAGTDIVFRQVLPRSELPPVARAVMPVDMVITRQQHFDPFDHEASKADGTYRATIPAGLGHFGGRYLLTDTDSGSQLRLASECKVHIPFVGGTLEQLILSNITQLFDAEGAFMADWVARRQ